ncbi:hypothetical protein C2U70_11735 [Bradyrhizobium guangdongense]|nr:hypothetical protein C2U70_11735 [Bradyrhizobium guangdongense]
MDGGARARFVHGRGRSAGRGSSRDQRVSESLGRPPRFLFASPRLRGEAGLHRRCNPGEGESPRVQLS